MGVLIQFFKFFLSKLLKALNESATDFGFNATNNLPKSPSHLTRRLKAVKSNLEEVGITFDFDKKKSDGVYVILKNKCLPPLPSYHIEIPANLAAKADGPACSLLANGGDGDNGGKDDEIVVF